MNYEKKYKEALANARQEYTTTKNVERKQWLEELFPELAESEDERIRKRLIDLIYKVYAFTNYITCVEYENIIAWLEKQGDTTSDIRYDGVNAGASLSVVNGNSFDYEKATITQKDFAPKEEPKFKVGDWLQYRNAKPFFVEEITKQGYVNGNSCLPFNWENEIHLWTIQDAKDGDVLVDKYGNIGIYQGDKNAVVWYSCCYCGVNKVFYTEGSHEFPCYPATKEQRDLLFQKMKEAGYELYDEKKKLKKIESQPAWSEEDGYNLQCMIAKVTFDIQKGNVGRNNELMDWLKSLKERVQPKQAWSEEDENYLQSAENACEYQYGKNTSTILWLKSLKDRMKGKEDKQ